MPVSINGTGSITGVDSISSPSITGVPVGSASAPSVSFTGDTNTGLYSPGADQVALSTGGTGRLFIDSSGRVGLGTSTPQRLLTTQIGSNGAGLLLFRSSETNNDYGGLEFGNHPSDITNYRKGAIYYVSDGTGFGRGAIYICNDSAGDANNVQPSDAKMVIDSSGRVGIGSNSPQVELDVNGRIRLARDNFLQSSDGAGGWVELIKADTSNNTVIRNNKNTAIILDISGNEAARIDGNRRLLVGTSTARSNVYGSFSPYLQLEGGSVNGQDMLLITRNQNDIYGPHLILAKSRGTANTIVASGDLLGTVSMVGNDGSSFIQAARIETFVDGTPGANDMPGRLVFSVTQDGLSSPTERMRITNSGTVLIGATSIPSPGSSTDVGIGLGESAGYAVFSRSGANALNICRQTNDGQLIAFHQGGTEEGNISVSGTTVSYNGAHLSRWSQLPGGTERTEILRGTVLSNIDEMCAWGDEENEQLNRMKVSDVEGDPNVAGVFQGWDDDDETYTDDFYCAMTGDFIIRIAQGVTVQRGQLLMSAGDGTAKPQGDGFVQDKTIAKVTSTHVTCTYEDGSYCVPCVLMAC